MDAVRYNDCRFRNREKTSETGHLLRFQFFPRKLEFSRNTQLMEKKVHSHS
jgi:hypothetical protein